jgi:4-hydroxybenzoate polyprenyltransferase
MKRLTGDLDKLQRLGIERVRNGESIRHVATDLGISRTTLGRRIHEADFAPISHEDQQKLSVAIEGRICDWIVAEEAGGRAPTARQVRCFCNLLLETQGGTDGIGRHWYQRFMNRHSDIIHAKKTRLIPRERILKGRSGELEAFFARLKHLMGVRGVGPSNLYNMDETGLREGFQRDSSVIGSTLVKPQQQPRAGATSWVTIIECIRATGGRIQPAVIFKGANVQTTWLPPGFPPWAYGASKSGWTNSWMTMGWLEQVFLPITRPESPFQWRILILDRHSTHVPADFQLKAIENKVQLIYLPAHASHRLQPLDLSVFGPLKTYYSHVIESFGEYSVSGPSNKRRFIRAYMEASEKAFSEENIRSGFRHTGIWPLYGEQVVEEVRRQEKPRTPPPEVTIETLVTLNTPTNRVQLVQMIQELQGTPSSVTHSRRQRGRKVVKYTDLITVNYSHEKARNHSLTAEIDAIRLPKRKRIARNPENVYISQQQIMAQMEGGDTTMVEDPEAEVANNAEAERFIIDLVQQDEGSL